MKYILVLIVKKGINWEGYGVYPVCCSSDLNKIINAEKEIQHLLYQIHEYYKFNKIEIENLHKDIDSYSDDNPVFKIEEIFFKGKWFENLGECLYDFVKERYYTNEELTFSICNVEEI